MLEEFSQESPGSMKYAATIYEMALLGVRLGSLLCPSFFFPFIVFLVSALIGLLAFTMNPTSDHPSLIY